VREPSETELTLSPRERIALLAHDTGTSNAALACEEILCGASDPVLLRWIGGRGALFDQEVYWHRVWALRAYLYVWDEQVTACVVAALQDEHWRGREMAAKVVALRELPAAHLLPALLQDPLPRVRAAGVRALGFVGEAENADAVLEALEDGDGVVSRAAAAALARLERRLDRRFG
jgi:hypothetical protein